MQATDGSTRRARGARNAIKIVHPPTTPLKGCPTCVRRPVSRKLFLLPHKLQTDEFGSFRPLFSCNMETLARSLPFLLLSLRCASGATGRDFGMLPAAPAYLSPGVPPHNPHLLSPVRPVPPTIAPPAPKLIPTTPPPVAMAPPPLHPEAMYDVHPMRQAVTTRDDLQMVHPPAPNEQDWVMATGNESAIDNVLAISLVYGGRLVSMGYYYRYQQIYYYAIMHKYDGPVFLKPNPYTYTELLKVARENEELDLGLTQLCGQDNGRGEVSFASYWERIPGVSHKIWFPGTPEADVQRRLMERNGYRLTSLCGYSVQNRAQYVGVWMKPALSKHPYEAYYGLSLTECLAKDKFLTNKGYVATQFRVFNNARSTLCTGIWEYIPGRTHSIEVGESVTKMYRRGQRSDILPRQISHFFDSENTLKYVVLWSNVNSNRYPNPPEIWNDASPIPATYLKGVPELLTEEQLSFITKRVEHFMKDLDIPGLSVAISKKEQLKFAAGYGYANLRRKEPVTPHNQFRIGSVSKPVTAAAILMLVEQDKFDLDDHVFGKSGLFGSEFSKKRSYGKYITDITVRHLLEHTAGGWNNLESDAAWIEPQLSTKELIEYVLENVPLTERPGSKWIYSNFGYQILGYIVERFAGMSYEEYVKKHIWDRVGVSEIQLARPTLGDRARREVLYYMSGNKVGFNPYEMLSPERIGPWGGWIASPIELLQFISHFDGFPGRKDLLSTESIDEWAVATKASNDTYGLGWSLNIMGFNGWQHDGRMPGSAAMLVRLENGLEMAVVVNKEYSERDFFHELGYVLHHIGNNCDWWNDDTDLFLHSN